MSEIKLPMKPVEATQTSPKRTVLFSKPKAGKTTILSKLPKCLILDFEEGTAAIDAMAYPIKTLSDIPKVCKAIRDAGYPYHFIGIDTISALEEMCMPEAERRYALSPEGKDWFLTDETDKLHKDSGKNKFQSILNLGYGKGYQYIADVYSEVLSMIEKHAPKTILLAHSVYATINTKDQEITALDIQLAKKCKFITTFKADAIGYVYRKGNKNFINFTANEDTLAGGRFRYLEKDHVLISEFIANEDGTETLNTYWENVYPELKAQPKKVQQINK